ncbi:MAG: hypothetical protein H6Q17_2077 [Bacteroidetes bacterium]|nr:hypothetical protein [Bacteroidota bacterium]
MYLCHISLYIRINLCGQTFTIPHFPHYFVTDFYNFPQSTQAIKPLINNKLQFMAYLLRGGYNHQIHLSNFTNRTNVYLKHIKNH